MQLFGQRKRGDVPSEKPKEVSTPEPKEWELKGSLLTILISIATGYAKPVLALLSTFGLLMSDRVPKPSFAKDSFLSEQLHRYLQIHFYFFPALGLTCMLLLIGRDILQTRVYYGMLKQGCVMDFRMRKALKDRMFQGCIVAWLHMIVYAVIAIWLLSTNEYGCGDNVKIAVRGQGAKAGEFLQDGRTTPAFSFLELYESPGSGGIIAEPIHTDEHEQPDTVRRRPTHHHHHHSPSATVAPSPPARPRQRQQRRAAQEPLATAEDEAVEDEAEEVANATASKSGAARAGADADASGCPCKDPTGKITGCKHNLKVWLAMREYFTVLMTTALFLLFFHGNYDMNHALVPLSEYVHEAQPESSSGINPTLAKLVTIQDGLMKEIVESREKDGVSRPQTTLEPEYQKIIEIARQQGFPKDKPLVPLLDSQWAGLLLLAPRVAGEDERAFKIFWLVFLVCAEAILLGISLFLLIVGVFSLLGMKVLAGMMITALGLLVLYAAWLLARVSKGAFSLSAEPESVA